MFKRKHFFHAGVAVLFFVVFFACGVLPAAERPTPSGASAPSAQSARDAVAAAADSYARELMDSPPDGLTRGSVAMAFGWIFLNDMLGATYVDKAVGYFDAALEGGVPEAGVVLGSIFSGSPDAGGHPADWPRAIAYYEKAAGAGSVDAMRQLGMLHADGNDSVKQDRALARQYLTEAARRGSAAAISALREMDGGAGEAGAGAERLVGDLVDPALAAEATERSAAVATATARVFDLLQARLADLELSVRTGGLPDAGQQELWRRIEEVTRDGAWELVESRPDDKAKGETALVLGIFHHIGLFHGVDLNEAESFMTYALEKGVPEARVTLGELYLGVTIPGDDGVRREVERGRALLLEAADAGSVDACRLLGLVYADGAAGLPADPAKAREYFLTAARHGDEIALERLGPDAPAGIVDAALEAAARDRNDELSRLANQVNAEMEEKLTRVLTEYGAEYGAEYER